jgi:hypothetical protein
VLLAEIAQQQAAEVGAMDGLLLLQGAIVAFDDEMRCRPIFQIILQESHARYLNPASFRQAGVNIFQTAIEIGFIAIPNPIELDDAGDEIGPRLFQAGTEFLSSRIKIQHSLGLSPTGGSAEGGRIKCQRSELKYIKIYLN